MYCTIDVRNVKMAKEIVTKINNANYSPDGNVKYPLNAKNRLVEQK